MGRVKDLYIEQHEKLIADYMEEHPDADEQDVYDETAQYVDAEVEDYLAEQGDYLYEQQKDRRLEEKYAK